MLLLFSHRNAFIYSLFIHAHELQVIRLSHIIQCDDNSTLWIFFTSQRAHATKQFRSLRNLYYMYTLIAVIKKRNALPEAVLRTFFFICSFFIAESFKCGNAFLHSIDVAFFAKIFDEATDACLHSWRSRQFLTNSKVVNLYTYISGYLAVSLVFFFLFFYVISYAVKKSG